MTSRFCTATRKCFEQTSHFTPGQVNAADIVYQLFVYPWIACKRWQLASTDKLSAFYYRHQCQTQHFSVNLRGYEFKEKKMSQNNPVIKLLSWMRKQTKIRLLYKLVE